MQSNQRRQKRELKRLEKKLNKTGLILDDKYPRFRKRTNDIAQKIKNIEAEFGSSTPMRVMLYYFIIALAVFVYVLDSGFMSLVVEYLQYDWGMSDSMALVFEYVLPLIMLIVELLIGYQLLKAKLAPDQTYNRKVVVAWYIIGAIASCIIPYFQSLILRETDISEDESSEGLRIGWVILSYIIHSFFWITDLLRSALLYLFQKLGLVGLKAQNYFLKRSIISNQHELVQGEKELNDNQKEYQKLYEEEIELELNNQVQETLKLFQEAKEDDFKTRRKAGFRIPNSND